MIVQLVLLVALSLFPSLGADSARSVSVTCPLSPAPACLKLVLSEDGIYRITPDDLQAAGWDVEALDPRTLSLSSQGQPVAIRVQGEADGRLDAGDFIEFYGQRFRGDQMAEKYTDANVYWLAAGGEPGLRMAEVDATPAGAPAAPASFWTTHRAEENNEWFTHHTMNWPTRDTWWWQRMNVRDAGDFPLPTELPAPAGEAYSATLQVELGTRREVGVHHFQLSWNELPDPVLDATFDGHQLHQAQASLPGSALQAGANVLTVTLINDPQQHRDSLDAGRPLSYATLDDSLLFHANAPAYVNDDVYVNHYELRYRRRYQALEDQLAFGTDVTGAHTFTVDGFSAPDLLLYDISDPLRPQWLSGGQVAPAGDSGYALTAQLSPELSSRFLALAPGQAKQPQEISAPLPATVRSPANGADWIAISHADFMAEAQRLADHRVAQDGLRTAVVDVAELYEQFNEGIFHPEAIRRFIAYAAEHWQPPAPQYILLIGDGNWNFKGYGLAKYGPPDPNWIPPYLVWEDPWQGEVGSDNAFVRLDDDLLPDLAIGRLPARSAAEAAVMVDKIITYETADDRDAAWRHRALFVADNGDASGDYPAVVESIVANHLPRNIRPLRAYLGVTHQEPSAVTNFMVQAINKGVFMVNYMGHGSVDWWTHEGVWNTSRTPLLANGSRLPVVLTFNCLDGYFIYGDASLQSVAEEMLRHPGGGSVAAWSPAGLGVTSVERVLYAALLDIIFRDGQQRLGPATSQAKAALFAELGGASPVYTALLHTMTLFGDPALTMSAPDWRPSFPLVTRRLSR